VEALLRILAEEKSLLKPLAEAVQATTDNPIREGPGTVIGPYKLMEQFGEGGMGLVFVAEQQHPVRRKVALKISKPGMDTRDVIARFEAERQALALMDQANNAHILDGGETASGRPYFVMELVCGVPVTDYCGHNHLPASQRLELFLTICQAVQHAHQKGIIHRDLKPPNALVTLHEGTPVVKVIDTAIPLSFPAIFALVVVSPNRRLVGGVRHLYGCGWTQESFRMERTPYPTGRRRPVNLWT
jgi:serine/threonine-protein kinase